MVQFLFIAVWFIVPLFVGIILLPLTPYLVNKFTNKKNVKLPSFVPFWASTVLLTLFVNNVWTQKINGSLFYEWDNFYIQYTLTSYQSPLLDGNNTWIAEGWSLWGLYALWILVTLAIYVVGTMISLLFYKNHKNLELYKKVLLKSSFYMLIIGALLSLLFYSHIPFYTN